MPNYPRKARKNQRLAVAPDNENALPSLTSKQESFVMGLLDGLKASEAYRNAYDATGMQDSSVHCEAWKLKTNPQIAQWLRFYQREGLQTKINQESHLAELARLREIAVENAQISAGVQAEHYRGRVAGLYEDKLRLSLGPSDEAILAQIQGLLGLEAAAAIAEGLGLERPPAGESRPLIDVTPNALETLDD